MTRSRSVAFPLLTAMALSLSPIAVAQAADAPAANQGAAGGTAENGALREGVPLESPHRIEVAFILDTTGSMSGLIEGAKKKIWSIASRMMDLEPKPDIRFALIGYRDRGDAYVTKQYDLTDDVQEIYRHLLAFKADGGGDTPESVNQALREGIQDLSWSEGETVFRVAFLVGDAPPHMDYDELQYPDILLSANEKDIIVNAVQAGAMHDTTAVWREIASRGGGDYVQIAQDGAMTRIETPFDTPIHRIQLRLDDTVLPYGGAEQRAMVEEKRLMSRSLAVGTSSDMAGYMRKRKDDSVVTGRGDLVEDLESGVVALETLEEAALPETLKALAPAERVAKIDEMRAARSALQSELDHMLEKRDAYIAEKMASTPSADDSFDAEVERMITTQAAAKGFSIPTEE